MESIYWEESLGKLLGCGNIVFLPMNCMINVCELSQYIKTDLEKNCFKHQNTNKQKHTKAFLHLQITMRQLEITEFR